MASKADRWSAARFVASLVVPGGPHTASRAAYERMTATTLAQVPEAALRAPQEHLSDDEFYNLFNIKEFTRMEPAIVALSQIIELQDDRITALENENADLIKMLGVMTENIDELHNALRTLELKMVAGIKGLCK